MVLIAAVEKPSVGMTSTHLTLSTRIEVKKSHFQIEEVIFETEVSANEHLSPIRVKNKSHARISGKIA